MSKPCSPEKAALVAAFMFSRGVDRNEPIEYLKKEFGPVAILADPFEFDFTSYYDDEMGPGIVRSFCLFENLVEQDALVWAKLITNEIEKNFLHNDKRAVNIDPGLLTASRLVLATGKQAPHRVYLGRKVFADLTLLYESGKFLPMKWTYPDYQASRTLDFLSDARKYYLNKMKQTKDNSL